MWTGILIAPTVRTTSHTRTYTHTHAHTHTHTHTRAHTHTHTHTHTGKCVFLHARKRTESIRTFPPIPELGTMLTQLASRIPQPFCPQMISGKRFPGIYCLVKMGLTFGLDLLEKIERFTAARNRTKLPWTSSP